MFGRVIGAVLAGMVLLAVIACGGGGDSSSPTPTSAASETPNVNLPPADAVVIFGSPQTTNAALSQSLDAGGPLAFYAGGASRDEASIDGVDLPDGATFFGASLLDPDSADFGAVYEDAFGEAPVAGVREAYDAVYLAALAAVAANSTAVNDVRDHLHYVANSPGQIANFGSDAFAQARDVLEAGGDVNYIGASGQLDLTSSGEVSKGQLQVWRLFGGQILGQEFRDVDLAAEIGAVVPAGELSTADETPGGPLRIGAILPLSGDDSNQGPAIQNGLQLAVDEINASGGVFATDVVLIIEDDAGDADQAVSAAESLESDGVSIIVGPVGRTAAQAVADEYANPTSVSVITLSPAAGLPVNAGEGFWRVVATGLLETPVLANLAVEAEIGVVCILYEGNADDLTLAQAFKAAFEYKEGAVRALVEVADGVDLTACLGS
jgi:ABC-type branched-subunit amino acid transport system substrate-binding protein